MNKFWNKETFPAFIKSQLIRDVMTIAIALMFLKFDGFRCLPWIYAGLIFIKYIISFVTEASMLPDKLEELNANTDAILGVDIAFRSVTTFFCTAITVYAWMKKAGVGSGLGLFFIGVGAVIVSVIFSIVFVVILRLHNRKKTQPITHPKS